jgi:hypothetical protein
MQLDRGADRVSDSWPAAMGLLAIYREVYTLRGVRIEL